MSAAQQGNGAEPAWVKAAANQSRLAFGLAVTELGKRDERVLAVSADTLDLIGLRGLIEHAPARVIDVGIAEQNAMGVGAGLATSGLRPFVCGYAPFITARSMEQIRNEVAYANQRVVIGAAARIASSSSGLIVDMLSTRALTPCSASSFAASTAGATRAPQAITATSEPSARHAALPRLKDASTGVTGGSGTRPPRRM